MVFLTGNTPPAEIYDSAETIYVCTDLPSVMLKSTDFSAQKHRGKLWPNRTAAPVKASCVPGHLPLCPRSRSLQRSSGCCVMQVTRSSVAGQGDLRRRSDGFPLQVCVFRLNGDANRPLVHSNVTGQAIFAERQRNGTRPATQKHPTGDANRPNVDRNNE